VGPPVWRQVPVPDSHHTISPGVVRKVNQAIQESEGAEIAHEYKVNATRDGRWSSEDPFVTIEILII
jgi:hypothetical protein